MADAAGTDSDVLAEDGFGRPVLAIDFDGVLHEYHGTPDGEMPVLDQESPPVEGAIDWLYDVGQYFDLVIFSTFASTDEHRIEMAAWLSLNGFFGVPYLITNEKPAAHLYVDDRGFRFNGPGSFPSPAEIAGLDPWWFTAPTLPLVEGDDEDALAASVQARAQLMEAGITDTLARVAKERGGEIVGLEDRFKPADSVAAKIGALASSRDQPLQDAAADVKDGLRYSLVFPDDEYAYETGASLASLEADGMDVERVRNYWGDHTDPERVGTYAGINAVVRAANGFPFEVQFHTPASYRVNQAANWDLYRQSRDPSTTPSERLAILDQMRANLADVPTPPGAADFSYPGASSSMTAAGRKAPPKQVSAAHLTEVTRAAHQRVDDLEQKLADLVRPILERAGDQAAKRFTAMATDHLTAGALFAQPAYLTAAADGDIAANSTMICVKPRPEEAQALATDVGVPAADLHVTLAYLGEIDGDLEPVAEALRAVAATHAPLVGEVAGAGFFGPITSPGPAILLPDAPGLVELRVDVTEALAQAEIDYSRLHGFEAHITTGYRHEPTSTVPAEEDYRPADGPSSCATCSFFDAAWRSCLMFDAEVDPVYVCDAWTDEPTEPVGAPLHFDALLVVRGDVVVETIPLVGRPPLTAAGEPTPWSAPAPDEIVDIHDVVSKLRTKTDPVRQAFVKATMTPALAKAGLSWDVTNPFTAKVLAQAGSQIVDIAKTTQLNVMRIVNASYKEGLSIPDTAKAIQEGMKAAAPARALLIARTELAGAVNGGSLAAASIVSSAGGGDFNKIWLTAPGAPYPRHEDYDGLDGQTVGLDDYFEVGDSQLMFPGDPDGDPGETINCRCALAYEDAAGNEAEGDFEPENEEG